jgi:hypothetical protein
MMYIFILMLPIIDYHKETLSFYKWFRRGNILDMINHTII